MLIFLSCIILFEEFAISTSQEVEIANSRIIIVSMYLPRRGEVLFRIQSSFHTTSETL